MCGLQAFYTLENNDTRTESISAAAKLDEATQQVQSRRASAACATMTVPNWPCSFQSNAAQPIPFRLGLRRKAVHMSLSIGCGCVAGLGWSSETVCHRQQVHRLKCSHESHRMYSKARLFALSPQRVSVFRCIIQSLSTSSAPD